MKKENQMLSRIASFLKGDTEAQTTEASTETVTLVVDASAVQAELDAFKTEFEAFKAEANALTAELESQLEQAVATAEAALAAKEEVIANLVAEKEEMIADALAKKLEARHAKVIAAIGTEKADALMTATKDLDDAAFDAVVSAMAGSFEAEATSALFTEVGVTAEADAAKLVTESKEMQILKQKYGAK